MKKYKTIGIIGGMGSLATADLFSRVLKYSEAKSDQEYPRIILDNNSSIPDRSRALVENGMSPVEAIVDSGKKLISIGAEILGMPCNTAHAYFEDLQEKLSVPLINMIDLTTAFIKNKHPKVQKVGILCTTGTRASAIYDVAFKEVGISVVYPSETEQSESVMKAIYGNDGLKNGVIEMPKKEITKVTMSLVNKGAEVMLLACTELTIALCPKVEVPIVDGMDVLAYELISKAWL